MSPLSMLLQLTNLYNKSYTKSNYWGERHYALLSKYLNVEMNHFKEAIAQLKAGESVWFGSDVGQSSNRQTGIMATNTTSLQVWVSNSIKTRLEDWDYSESLMTHAMVLTGVDLDDNEQPLSNGKWKTLGGGQGWRQGILRRIR